MLGEPWIRNVPFTKQSQTDCTSVSACAGKTYSFVWLKSAKRTGRLATVRRNTRNRFTEQETLEGRMKDTQLTQNNSPAAGRSARKRRTGSTCPCERMVALELRNLSAVGTEPTLPTTNKPAT